MFLNGKRRIVAYNRRPGHTSFGCDQHHSMCGPCSVNCSGRSVFKYLNRSDIIWIYKVKNALSSGVKPFIPASGLIKGGYRKPIDNIQGLIACIE